MKEFVTCPLCKCNYKSITKNHLIKKHNLTLEDFLKTFPGFKLECEELHNRRCEVNKLNSNSEDIRKFRSLKAKAQHESSNLNTSVTSKEMWENSEKRSYIISRMKEAQKRPEVIRRKSLLMLERRRNDPDYQKKLLSNEEVRKAKISKASKERWLTHRNFIIQRMIEAQKDPKLLKHKSELMKIRRLDPEFNRIQRDAMIKLFEDDEWVRNLSKSQRNRTFNSKWYGSFHVRSSYEEIVCSSLEVLNIPYEYEKHKFRYTFEGEEHTYRVDYYLPTLGLFIEVKPKYFQKDPKVIAKFGSVINRGLNIIFADEDTIFNIEDFKKLLFTSTTIPRP